MNGRAGWGRNADALFLVAQAILLHASAGHTHLQ
jgi:hypothetical protein